MSDYEKWTDADLLAEADERDLNTVEADMLDSMMKQAERRPLTPKQRDWLYRVLDEKDAGYGPVGDDDL